VTYYWTLNLIVTSEKKTPDPFVCRARSYGFPPPAEPEVVEV
jgi:hypothetical protein